MFTGIIETIGTVKKIRSRGNYKILTIAPDKLSDDMVLGESIAVDGCCLTLIEFDRDGFTVEASQETVRLTILKNYKTGDRVNLERALQPSGRLGGHFVNASTSTTGSRRPVCLVSGCKVRSRRGEIKVRAKVSDKAVDGTVFVPFHYAEGAANELTNTALDPVAMIPELKVCAVRIERA